MKVRTHYHITKLAIELYLIENYISSNNTNFDSMDSEKKELEIKKNISKKEKFDLCKISINQNLYKNILGIKDKMYIEILCLSSMLPDLMPSQFIHHHFYQKSKTYIFKKIEKLINEEKTSFFNVITIGEIAHYLSDFSCFAHRSESIRNPREHILYERELNRYMLKNLGEIRNKVLKSSNLENEIINGKKGFESKPGNNEYIENNIDREIDKYNSNKKISKNSNRDSMKRDSIEIIKWISNLHKQYLTTDKSYEYDLLLSVVLVKAVLENVNMTKLLNISLICA